MQGSDPAGLESKIQQYSKASDGEEGEVVAGQVRVITTRINQVKSNF